MIRSVVVKIPVEGSELIITRAFVNVSEKPCEKRTFISIRPRLKGRTTGRISSATRCLNCIRSSANTQLTQSLPRCSSRYQSLYRTYQPEHYRNWQAAYHHERASSERRIQQLAQKQFQAYRTYRSTFYANCRPFSIFSTSGIAGTAGS